MAAIVSTVSTSEEEELKVESLKQQLAAVEPELWYKFTDTAVLRFLRGRKGDIEKTFRALTRHVQWREENNVTEILEDTEGIRAEIESGRLIVSGFDKLGRPLVSIIARRHNKDDRDLDRIRRYIIYTIETVQRAAKPEEEKMTIIFDLSGFGLYCMDYDAVKILINILQFNYPETLSVAYIVSAPMLFSACWMVIRPWLDPVTAAKCVFVNAKKLSEFVDPSMIPPEVLNPSMK